LSKTRENEIAMSADPMVDYAEYQAVIDDYAASEKEVRRLRRVVMSLQRELNDKREDSPRAKDIREILDYYVTLFGKTRAFKVGPDTQRWKDVDNALKAHTVKEIKEAIDGLHALPYVGPHGRVPSGSEDQRHDEIDIPLRNEKTIDRFRGYVSKAKAMRGVEAEAFVSREVRRLENTLTSWRDPVEAILSAQTALGLSWKASASGEAWSFQCPAHDDRSPSLSVRWNVDHTKLLVKCWAGCEVPYVMAAWGLPLSVLFCDEAAL
jgi:hypothetical protein